MRESPAVPDIESHTAVRTRGDCELETIASVGIGVDISALGPVVVMWCYASPEVPHLDREHHQLCIPRGHGI